MLGLSEFRLTAFSVYINTDGTISTYNQNGVIIIDLSGHWTIIHKIVKLITKSGRRDYMEEKYDDSIVPNITFYIRAISSKGETMSSHPITSEQFYEISKYIKKR